MVRAQTNDVGAATTNTTARQKINDLRAAYLKACDGVRGDASLSELGKQQILARAWVNTRAEIAKLTQQDFDTRVARYDSLEREVFGTAAASSGADAVSFRDATDRASELESAAAAAKLLGTAELSGDTVLAKAVVLKAWESRWDTVVEHYAVNHATVADKLAELVSLREGLDSLTSRLANNMGASLHQPTELTGLSLADINKYAPADPARSLEAVQLARMRGDATPQDEADARRQAR
jgi:hypothetical protein